MAEKLVAFRIPQDLKTKLNTAADVRGCGISKVIRDALNMALELDPVIEGVIQNLQHALGRDRADIIECILIQTIAADMARIAADPGLPVSLSWAAIGPDGQPLRGQKLFDYLHKRYLGLLQGKNVKTPNIKILSYGEDIQLPDHLLEQPRAVMRGDPPTTPKTEE